MNYPYGGTVVIMNLSFIFSMGVTDGIFSAFELGVVGGVWRCSAEQGRKKGILISPQVDFFFFCIFLMYHYFLLFFSLKCHCDQPIMNNHFTFLLYCNSLLLQGCRIDICYADSLRKGHHNLLILDFSISLILISLSPFLNRNLSFCYCYMSV